MNVEQNKEFKMTVFELLNLRTQWEGLVQNMAIPDERKEGHIANLNWFVTNSVTNNRFRKGYKEAVDLANKILNG